MKIILKFIGLFMFFGCSNTNNDESKIAFNKTPKLEFKKAERKNGVFINIIDNSNLKQGLWHEERYVVLNKLNGPELVVKSKGFYKNNKKVGYWVNFDDYGNIEDSVFMGN